MGYACPVCSAPQTDGEHLANHLAFTAMLREDDHEEWLDSHVPDWSELNPADLAGEVTPHAPETEVETVFEDTTGGDSGHGHDHAGHDHAGHDHASPGSGQSPGQFEDELARHAGYGRDSLSGADQEILAEAQEMTREMLGGEDEEDDDADESTGGSDVDTADDVDTESE